MALTDFKSEDLKSRVEALEGIISASPTRVDSGVYINADYGSKIIKNGSIKELALAIGLKSISTAGTNGWKNIYQIPDAYKPIIDIGSLTSSQDTQPVQIGIFTDGFIKINIKSGHPIVQNDLVSITITYI